MTALRRDVRCRRPRNGLPCYDMYKILWDDGAKEDMSRMKLRAYDARRIVDAVDNQLTHEPERETKHKKLLRPAEPLPFEHLEPVWQLGVADFRVFYDVVGQEAEKSDGQEYRGVVSIRAVRRKPAHKTTKEIL